MSKSNLKGDPCLERFPENLPDWWIEMRHEMQQSSLYLPFRDLIRQQLYTQAGVDYKDFLDHWEYGVKTKELVSIVDQVEKFALRSPLWAAIKSECGLKIEQLLKRMVNQKWKDFSTLEGSKIPTKTEIIIEELAQVIFGLLKNHPDMARRLKQCIGRPLPKNVRNMVWTSILGDSSTLQDFNTFINSERFERLDEDIGTKTYYRCQDVMLRLPIFEPYHTQFHLIQRSKQALLYLYELHLRQGMNLTDSSEHRYNDIIDSWKDDIPESLFRLTLYFAISVEEEGTQASLLIQIVSTFLRKIPPYWNIQKDDDPRLIAVYKEVDRLLSQFDMELYSHLCRIIVPEYSPPTLPISQLLFQNYCIGYSSISAMSYIVDQICIGTVEMTMDSHLVCFDSLQCHFAVALLRLLRKAILASKGAIKLETLFQEHAPAVLEGMIQSVLQNQLFGGIQEELNNEKFKKSFSTDEWQELVPTFGEWERIEEPKLQLGLSLSTLTLHESNDVNATPELQNQLDSQLLDDEISLLDPEEEARRLQQEEETRISNLEKEDLLRKKALLNRWRVVAKSISCWIYYLNHASLNASIKKQKILETEIEMKKRTEKERLENERKEREKKIEQSKIEAQNKIITMNDEPQVKPLEQKKSKIKLKRLKPKAMVEEESVQDPPLNTFLVPLLHGTLDVIQNILGGERAKTSFIDTSLQLAHKTTEAAKIIQMKMFRKEMSVAEILSLPEKKRMNYYSRVEKERQRK